MIFNKIKTFYHKNEIIRDYVYMIGLFLNLLDTQTEKDKFQLLYNTYCDLLYWIALKRTNRVEDAEECVQETFLYIAKHFDKIGEINSKKTKIYLSTIVTGFAIDIYNDSQKAEFIEIENDNETADLKYYENFAKIELLAIIDDVLDEENRVFFHLKYFFHLELSFLFVFFLSAALVSLPDQKYFIITWCILQIHPNTECFRLPESTLPPHRQADLQIPFLPQAAY